LAELNDGLVKSNYSTLNLSNNIIAGEVEVNAISSESEIEMKQASATTFVVQEVRNTVTPGIPSI